MEEVHAVHGLVSDDYVVKDQPVYEALLHPPEQLWFVLDPGPGRYGDVLEGDPVQIPRAPPSVIWATPGRDGLHHDLEVHVGGPGVLHPDVPEGDGGAPRALALSSHIPDRTSGRVMELGPGVHHCTVLYYQGLLLNPRCSYKGNNFWFISVSEKPWVSKFLL